MLESTKKTRRIRDLLLAAALSAPVVLTGCDDDGQDEMRTTDAAVASSPDGSAQDGSTDSMGDASTLASDGGPITDAASPDDGGTLAMLPSGYTLAVAGNGGASAGTIDLFASGTLTSSESGTFMTGTNEGAAFDGMGALVQAGDGVDPLATGIRTFCRPVMRIGDSAGMYDPSMDRTLAGSMGTGLKGLTVIDSVGWYVAASTGASQIQVYSQSAAGDADPLFTAGLGSDTNVWDAEYDANNDRLFAALTNGSVAVYDDFAAGRTASPSRVFMPDAPAATLSNFHGIAYDSESDTLFVTDVAAASESQGVNYASDGSILVFTAASTLSGTVTPAQTIAGASTMLGNPVDAVLVEGTLFVAEKTNDMLLAWIGIRSLGSGDIGPQRVAASTKPESIAVLADDFAVDPDISDLDTLVTLDAVVATQNPSPTMSGMPAMDTFMVRWFAPTLASAAGSFIAGSATGAGGVVTAADRLLESITLDQLGNAYITFDNNGIGGTGAGGILVVNHLSLRDGMMSAVPMRDRVILGANTGLVAPKGIEAVGSRGALLVADTGAGIHAFSMCASGNIAPMFTTANLGAASAVWDVDYDPSADRLYAAATDGTILVFDDFMMDSTNDDGPDRVITPTFMTAGYTSTNIHGIVFDAESDTLYVSDVGQASGMGAATDGALYRITSAATASGDTLVAGAIFGPQSMLGNPVDVAWDGANLYVAEKSNGMMLRFDGFGTLATESDAAPSASIALSAAESVALLPSSLASQSAP